MAPSAEWAEIAVLLYFNDGIFGLYAQSVLSFDSVNIALASLPFYRNGEGMPALAEAGGPPEGG